MNRHHTPLRLLFSAFCVILTGCAHAPMISVGGSYFPSWMICLAMSIALVLCLRVFLRHRGMEAKINLLPLLYPGLVVLLSCAIWLALFR